MSVNKIFAIMFIVLNIFERKIYTIGLAEFKFDPLVLSNLEVEFIYSINALEWLNFTKLGCESNLQEKSLETNLLASNIVVKNGTISHAQLLDTLPGFETKTDNELANDILKSSLYIYNSKCAPQRISGEHCAALLSDIKLPNGSELLQKCHKVVSDHKNESFALRRLIPRYYQDGFYKMFTKILPQPLTISQSLGRNQGKKNHELLDVFERNLAVVQWSQFVANDLNKPVARTMSDGSPIECCNIQNYKLSPRYHHPACAPLISKDVLNSSGPDKCFNYVRSALTVGDKCTFALPEHSNQASAKLDLSQLYGFNEKAQRRMRLHQNGLLKSTNFGSLRNSLLPMAAEYTNWFCAAKPKSESNSSCFMAGDSRVNSDPLAIIIYTIMMRNHNRVAKELSFLHPDWQDDQLFQKAKSINIDIYKRIVFNEWLPTILGPSLANEITKTENNVVKNNFEDEFQYQISNEYAVAASRFYLSMMPNELHNYLSPENESLKEPGSKIFILKDEIYSPSIEYSSQTFQKILYSLLMQQAMKLDSNYVESFRPDLANNKPPTHSDILAFDIQRGRDHGLQPYFKYVEMCSNIKINSWSDLERLFVSEDLHELKKIYSSWRDIDLIVGGISEISAKNSTVGSTFQCIIGEQFSKLRQWDRSENDLTDLDLLKWKSVTATDLLCITTNLQQVPLNIFQISSKSNTLANCSERLKGLNFNENY